MAENPAALKEALLYEKTREGEVVCNLCSHRCQIKESKRGICGVRENRHGTLYSLVYRKLISDAVDPIEKKPLFHFLPGSISMSVATVGCNFRCRHCQNADIAQMPHDLKRILGQDVSPEDIVRKARDRKCETISYTYTEPTVFFEYAYETAKLATAQGVRNVFVSNGYMTPEAIEQIAPFLHAVNIDLKGLEPFYKKICGAHLQPVVESIRRMHELGIWVEVTTLVIPTLNDGEEELRTLGEIVAGIDPCIPWHISAFHPAYRLLDKPRTPGQTLLRAKEIGMEAGLRYVYLGNLPGAGGENTLCHHCAQPLIERTGYRIRENRLREGRCPHCETVIPGVWA